MGEIVRMDNGKDNEIMAMMNDASLCPLLEETKVGVSNYTKLPVTRLATMGTAFQPLTTAVQTAVTGAGGSGLYYVNTAGKTMFQMKETGNFIGSLKTSAGLVGGGQAQMMPLAFDPTMLFMAAALANIDKKLDSIKEMQQEMMDFLVQKEKAELKGNLTFLYDVFNNYKYNWNNEMYKNSNHTMVLAIKKEAEAKIVFYREQIIAKVNKKFLIHSDQTVNKQLQAVQDQFKDYQLALYTLAFSSFLDVMLVGNYDKEYLSGISEKLDDYSMKYRELYTQCYEEISGYSSTSIQSSLLKGLSKTTKAVGKIVERIPVVGDTQADETLIAAGEKLGDIDGCSQEECLVLLEKYGELLINDGMNRFGYGCHESQDEIMLDKYNVVTIYSQQLSNYNDFFEAHGIEKVESLITAWDTFSDATPGQAERCDCKGKSVYNLPEELKDWGMYLADTRAE